MGLVSERLDFYPLTIITHITTVNNTPYQFNSPPKSPFRVALSHPYSDSFPSRRKKERGDSIMKVTHAT